MEITDYRLTGHYTRCQANPSPAVFFDQYIYVIALGVWELIKKELKQYSDQLFFSYKNKCYTTGTIICKFLYWKLRREFLQAFFKPDVREFWGRRAQKETNFFQDWRNNKWKIKLKNTTTVGFCYGISKNIYFLETLYEKIKFVSKFSN